jgi:hypothetical protein
MAFEVLVFLGGVAVIAVIGIGIGMLVARPLDRRDADADVDDAHESHEEPGGDDRTND